MSQTMVGRKLGRKRGFRQHLLKHLATELLRYEQIRTTFPKAKECCRLTDHIISLAKKDDLNARRSVLRYVSDREVFKKVFDVLVQRYGKRTGGYTRIFRLAPRQGDNAEIALIKLMN